MRNISATEDFVARRFSLTSGDALDQKVKPGKAPNKARRDFLRRQCHTFVKSLSEDEYEIGISIWQSAGARQEYGPPLASTLIAEKILEQNDQDGNTARAPAVRAGIAGAAQDGRRVRGKTLLRR